MVERLSMIADLARNPAANPTATAIGIAIVAVFLLLVIVVLLAWALPGSARPRQAAPRKPSSPVPAGPPSPVRTWGSRVITAVLVVAAIAVFYGMTSQSAFCGTTCHAMLDRGESWAKSSHKDVLCVRCHEGPLVLSAPSALLSRSHSVYAQLTGRIASGGSSVPSSRCLDCHRDIGTKVTVSKSGLAMSHAQVIARGSACEDCHGAQGHAKAGELPTMASCLRCHDGVKASATCSTCHRKTARTASGANVGAATDDSAVPDGRFGRMRGPNKPTCEGCHPQDTCDACHGLRMPHPVNYEDPMLHARPASFTGKTRVCYRCHTFRDCDPCHLDFGAHGPGWLQKHRKYPRNTTWCVGCHQSKNMCVLCH